MYITDKNLKKLNLHKYNCIWWCKDFWECLLNLYGNSYGSFYLQKCEFDSILQ